MLGVEWINLDVKHPMQRGNLGVWSKGVVILIAMLVYCFPCLSCIGRAEYLIRMVATLLPKAMGSYDNMLCIAWINAYGSIAEAGLTILANTQRSYILPLAIEGVVFPHGTISHVRRSGSISVSDIELTIRSQ